MDPFDVLGLPARFDLQELEIDAAYLARAAVYHPDLVGDAEEAGRAMARLNDAKRALLDAERRAVALLERLGGPGQSADKSLPPGFLMDMMEHRTAMEEELSQADPQARGTAQRKWESWGQERRREEIARVGELFASLEASDDAAARASAVASIRTRLNAWRYVERLLEQVRGAGPM